MLNAGEQESGVTLGRWLLRGPSRREVLLTGTTHAKVSKLLVLKWSGTVGTATKSALCVASKATSSETATKDSRVRRGKASIATATARPLYSSSSPHAVPLSVPGAKQPG